MSKRSYGQYCGLAHALDLIGERWTLLLIRELLTGPKRYKDLLKRLPGMGTNLLAQRLKALEAHELIERSLLPPPASTEAYILTDLGCALEPALLALVAWGYRTIPRPHRDTVHFPGWSVLAMKTVFRADKADDVADEYEYRVDDEVFHARIQNKTLTTGQGPGQHPDFVLETDGKTFLAVVSGQMTMDDALHQNRVTIRGDMQAFRRSLELFDLSPLHDKRDAAFPTLDLTGRPAPGARRLR